MTNYPARAQFETTVGVAQYLGRPNTVPGSFDTLPPLTEGQNFTVDYPAGMFTLVTPQPPEVTHLAVMFEHTNDPPPLPQKPDYGGENLQLIDFAALRQYVQQSRDYLALPTPNAVDNAQQIRRNTRALFAIIRYLMP